MLPTLSILNQFLCHSIAASVYDSNIIPIKTFNTLTRNHLCFAISAEQYWQQFISVQTSVCDACLCTSSNTFCWCMVSSAVYCEKKIQTVASGRDELTRGKHKWNMISIIVVMMPRLIFTARKEPGNATLNIDLRYRLHANNCRAHEQSTAPECHTQCESIKSALNTHSLSSTPAHKFITLMLFLCCFLCGHLSVPSSEQLAVTIVSLHNAS